MLDIQNQGPPCTACGSPTKLSAIEPSSKGQDLRTFTCPKCSRVQRHLIDSAVTEAWVKPKPVVKAGSENAVTNEIHNGRMIPKPAK
jgi:hypothetical protein